MTSSTTLTQRRKEFTRLDLARSAARLFAADGVSAVTTERIADGAGVSLRTFYRYFRTKEESVAPLLSVGADQWRQALADTGPGDPRTAIPQVIRALLDVDGGAEDSTRRMMRGLLRAAAEDDALLAVWDRVNRDSEERLQEVITGLVPDVDPLAARLMAAAATDAVRIGFEHWAADAGCSEPPAELAVRAFEQLSRGIRLHG
ncbi:MULTISPECIES: TetR/AcrR family transcriptional regulator [Actinomycetes]|uniref:TetR/AcrR family transcriptional regulator n=1 Tax=Actinomycetes TaxID=1760 RepID=UPI0031DF5AD2